MSTYFYAAPIVSGADTVIAAVGTAAGVGDASGLSVTPQTSHGSASATGTAVGVGSYIFIHHVALPRPAPGETTCDC